VVPFDRLGMVSY